MYILEKINIILKQFSVILKEKKENFLGKLTRDL
jgi:hypothetical protein